MKTPFILMFILSVSTAACVSFLDSNGACKPLTSVDCEMHFSATCTPIIHTTGYTITRDARIQQVDDKWERTSSRKRTSTRRLTHAGWQQFQKTLVNLDVYHWRPKYVSREIIYDGCGWEFRISEGTHTVESIGVNAGPSPNNPQKTANYHDDGKASADIILEQSLDDLWRNSSR